MEDGIDGVDNDVLIDDESFLESNALTINYGDGSKDVVNVIEFYTGSVTSEEKETLKRNARIAYDAFDRDHPEVFWLSGSHECYW